jgi:2-haloacid dehalogenase
MKYAWLLFDADGTLFDFERAEADALAETFAEAGLPLTPDYAERYRQFNQQVWREFERGETTAEALRTRRFALLFDAIGLNTDLAAISERYLHHLANQPHLIDGALEVVVELSRRCRLAVLTNGLKAVQRPRMMRSAIQPFIGELIVSEEVGAAKPGAAIFDAAFARMGQPAKSEVLMVGDSLTSDIRGGFDYGIDTCWHNPAGLPLQGPATPTYEIRRLGELLSIVR